METTEHSHSYGQFDSSVTILINTVNVKLEPDIVETETVIPKTEPNGIEIVEYEVPVHTNKPIIKLKTPCSKIQLDTENCNIPGRRASEKTNKAKLSQNNLKLLKVSHKNKRFTHICEICDAKFNRFRILEAHMLDKHGGGKSVDNKCRCCKFIFKQPSCLRHHINRAHLCSKTNKLAYCPHCYKIFNMMEQLHTHIKRMHVTIAPGMIYCKECHATFQSKNKLERHIKLKHSKNDEHSNRRVKCKLCHRNFNHRYYFKEHYEEIHLNGSSVRQFPCQKCTCFFRHSTSLYRHLQLKHVKYQSNIFLSSAKPLQTLREHKNNNHKINFKCDYCNLNFTLKDNLIDHIRLTHNSPPLLPYTGLNAKLICADTLEDNLVISQATICPICGIEFATPKSLRSHSRVHSWTTYSNKSRVFICDLCETSFTTKFTLRRHIQSHMLESEFECRICSQLFKTKSNLNTHVRLRHKPPRARQKDSFARSESPQLKLDSNQQSTNLERHIKCFKCNEMFNQGRLFRKHMTDDHKVIIIFR